MTSKQAQRRHNNGSTDRQNESFEGTTGPVGHQALAALFPYVSNQRVQTDDNNKNTQKPRFNE